MKDITTISFEDRESIEVPWQTTLKHVYKLIEETWEKVAFITRWDTTLKIEKKGGDYKWSLYK